MMPADAAYLTRKGDTLAAADGVTVTCDLDQTVTGS